MVFASHSFHLLIIEYEINRGRTGLLLKKAKHHEKQSRETNYLSIRETGILCHMSHMRKKTCVIYHIKFIGKIRKYTLGKYPQMSEYYICSIFLINGRSE